MKKSFLKRAMAAAIAVPVALTQTVLCVAFAEEAPAATTEITVDTVLNAFKKETKVSETETTRVWEQESAWYAVMSNAVDAMAGKTVEIDAKALAQEIPAVNEAAKLVKDILANNVTAVATVDADGITITADVDYTYSADASDIIANKLEGLVEGADIEINVSDLAVKGQLVLRIDTTKMNPDKTVSATAKIVIDGEEKSIDGVIAYAQDKLNTIKADVYAEIDKNVTKYQGELDEAKALIAEKQAEVDDARAEVAEKQAEVDDAQAKLDEAVAEGADASEEQADLDEAQAKLADATAKLDDAQVQLDDAWAQADDAQTKLDAAEKIANETAEDLFNSYQSKLDKLPDWKSFEKSASYSGANCDDIIAQVKADLADYPYVGSYVDKIPDTVVEVLNKNITTRLMTKAIQLISEKSGGSVVVNVTVDDLAAVAESLTEITVGGSVAGGAGTAELHATLTDAVDVDALKAYYEEKYEDPRGYDIVDFSVETVVDASAEADGNTLEASGVLEIKRTITYTVVEEEPTEPTETDPTETDPTETDPTETDPTETDPTETDPTETDPTETDPTETDPTETDPTETDPTETDPTETDPTETDPTETDPTEPPTDAPHMADNVVVDVDGTKNYFFSHDESVLEADELIKSAEMIVTENGVASPAVDVMSLISFGLNAEDGPIEGLTPAMVYEENGAAYAAMTLYIYYTAVGQEPELIKDATVTIFVGVKGDANLDGAANAKDAAEVLVYAAEKGANNNPSLYSEDDEVLETLAYFLADVDGESRECGEDGSDLNAVDAACILVFAAEKAAHPGRSVASIWDTTLHGGE